MHTLVGIIGYGTVGVIRLERMGSPEKKMKEPEMDMLILTSFFIVLLPRGYLDRWRQ